MSVLNHVFHSISFKGARNRKISYIALILVQFLAATAAQSQSQKPRPGKSATEPVVKETQFVPHITQIDTKAFPLVRVYVSITDDSGNPIPDNLPVDLFLYEEGREVSHNVLSTGWAVSSVLVMDESGSMNDAEKLEKAKEAAKRYIEMAEQQHQIALVGFSDAPHVLSEFGADRNLLLLRVRQLSANGKTALQDGIGVALDLLRGRTGRRVVVAVTDGIENNSNKFQASDGFRRLLESAKADGISIYTIGLGQDVNDTYLKKYQETKGTYFFSPSPNELKSIFERTVKLLAKEVVIEYTTASPDRDGMSPNISVNLQVKNQVVGAVDSYTKSGVIPHVRGDHFPYLMLCLFLFIFPKAATATSQMVSILRLRFKSVERLSATSEAVIKKLRDRNSPDEDEYRFRAGDLVVNCPTPDCPRVYYVRSWRFSECQCICDQGRGRYCYVSVLPKWLRKALDYISSKHSTGQVGRSFLCRCCGDADGF